MAIQYINTGSSANSGDGDSLRTAFTKINRNFGEIATLIGTTATEFTEIVQDSVEGMFVHSSHTGVTAVYDDDNDKIILTVTATGSGNGSVYQGDIPPTANTSTLWYDTVNGKSFVYYDGYWVEASPTTAGPTGPSGPSGAASSVAGPTGPSGPSGASLAGPQGPTGPSGANGTIGVDGATGPTGPMAFQQGSPFTWTSLTAYNENDIVTYVGSLFILSDYPSYIQSYTPDTYEGWRLFLPAGSTGPTGPEGPQGPSWTTDQNAELNTTGSPTFATLTVTSTATFLGDIVGGQYQGYDDISLIKDDPSEANITIRNLHNDGSGVLRIVDNISGGLHISHQNSTLSAGSLNAGENYIHGESPNDILNIGLYSDLNFYADSNKYFNPSDPTTASIQISAADRSVTFNATATFVYDLFVGVVQGYDDISLIKDDPSEVNITLRNLHNDGSSVIRLVDNLSGGLHISHQNSTMSSGSLNAGENYIHGESPNDKLNIGLYSDLNFYADSNKYYNPGDPTTASIQIIAADRTVRINVTATTGHIIPQEDILYDLGSPTKQWRSLYLSSSTLYVAGRALSVDANGSLTYEGSALDAYSPNNPVDWIGSPTVSTFSQGLDELASRVSTIESTPAGAGPTGPEGPQGPSGADSLVAGPEGPQGPQGPSGANGSNGAEGPQGVTGPQGPQGVNGTDGPQGPEGPQGPQGPSGADGTSVNISGTTSTSAALPFPYGGSNGDGFITQDDGHLWVYGSGTWTDVGTIVGPVGPQGPQGPQGDTGPQGPQGPSGANGTIGVDGATGPQGPQGPQGPVGDTGAQGPQGPTGNTGPEGPQGPVGNTGPQGPQGPQGVTGPTGPIAGSDTQVIFNDGGVAGANAGLTYNKTSQSLTVSGNISVNGGYYNTTATTAYIVNTTATTVYIAGGATIGTTIGNAAGTTTLLGNVQGSTNGFTIGYKDIPQLSYVGSTTLAATDGGKHYYSTLGTNTALTIPPSSSINFAIGTAVNVINQGTGAITITQGVGVTLYLAGNATSGNRSLAAYGMATLQKVASDTWFVVGVGLS